MVTSLSITTVLITPWSCQDMCVWPRPYASGFQRQTRTYTHWVNFRDRGAGDKQDLTRSLPDVAYYPDPNALLAGWNSAGTHLESGALRVAISGWTSPRRPSDLHWTRRKAMEWMVPSTLAGTRRQA